MQLPLPRLRRSWARPPAVCRTARLARRFEKAHHRFFKSACLSTQVDIICSSADIRPLLSVAFAQQALRQQMDILQAQLSALQALQTSAPQPSLPAHLQTQPVSSVSLDQPASAAQAASEAAAPSVSAEGAASATAAEPPSAPSTGADSQAGASGSDAASQVPATSAVAAEESPEEQMRKQRLQRFAASE